MLFRHRHRLAQLRSEPSLRPVWSLNCCASSGDSLRRAPGYPSSRCCHHDGITIWIHSDPHTGAKCWCFLRHLSRKQHLLWHHLRLHSRDSPRSASGHRLCHMRRTQQGGRHYRSLGRELCKRRDHGAVVHLWCPVWPFDLPESSAAI